MKRLNTSNITTGASLPLKSGSLDFIQDSYKELLSVLIESSYDMIPAPPGYCSYLYFFINSKEYLYINGELFEYAGHSSGTGTNSWFEIVTNQYTGNGINADSVEFTDGIQRNIHNIRKIRILYNSNISVDPSGFGIFSYLYQSYFSYDIFSNGDIRMFTCDQQYIDDNFNTTFGAGSAGGVLYDLYSANDNSELYGWGFFVKQITDPGIDRQFAGRTIVGYDPVNYPIGSTSGSKDAVLVEHNHDVKMYLGAGLLAAGGGVGLLGQNINSSTTNAGVGEDGIGKNMQPYKVILYLRKIY